MVTRRRLLKRGIVAGAVSTGTVTTGSADQSDDSIESFVHRSGTELHVDGKTWYFNGTNNYTFATGDCCYIHDEWMRRYAELGFNAIRTWTFLVGPRGGRTFQPEPGVYDEEALDVLDYTVHKAKQHGIRLVLPFVDNWPWLGGMDQYVQWSDQATTHDDFYTDPQCRQWYKDWVEYLLTRENNYTGIEYRNEPTIAIWEVANEPRAVDAGADVLEDWLVEMSAHVKRIDDTHLLSTGMEGFYSREFAGGGIFGGADGTDYIRHHDIDDIDLCSFHAYPNHWAKSDEWITRWIRDHVREAHELLGKPAYCGEFSWEAEDSTDPHERQERNEAMETWYQAMEETNANGALVWQVIADDWVSPEGPDISFEHERTLDVMDSFSQVQRQRSGRSIDDPKPDEETDRFVDDCSDLTALQKGSDLDSLRVDSTNPAYFGRYDATESADASRITRDGTTDRCTLVYAPDGLISGFSVEGHHHQWDGCQFECYVASADGDTWKQVPVSASRYGDVEATWHTVRYQTGAVPAGAERLRIDITGGDADWDGQIGHVDILLEGEEGAIEPDQETYVDDCAGLESLDGRSDLDSLRVDTTNPAYFTRNDGTFSTDDDRITRDGTTETRSLVYDPQGIVTGFTVEGHVQQWEGGELSFSASTAGDDSWTEVSVSRTPYGEVEAGWQGAEYTADALPDRTEQIRIDLVGGDADWGTQVGHVHLDIDSIAEDFVDETFVDDCADRGALAPASDIENLTVDTGGALLSSDGACSTATSRLTREGTTGTTSLYYQPGGELQQARVEAYEQTAKGGLIEFYASKDGGDTWRQLWPAETSYDSCPVADGWEGTSYKALWMPAGTDTFRIDLCCGTTPEALQIGRVEIDSS
jgi:mannan endo-1,4-beta-mannosidase